MHTGSKGQNLEIRDILYCFVVNLSSCGYVLLQQIPAQLTVIKLCNKVIPQVAFNIIFHSQSLLVLFCSRRRSRYGKDGDVCKQDPAKVSNFSGVDFPQLAGC